MLRGLLHTQDAQAALPFVRMFYSQPSTYLWVDANNHVHHVHQAEGGEQGDPLMPALFSLGLDFALRAFQAELQPGERVAAFLDDLYVTAQPHRIRHLFDRLAHPSLAAPHRHPTPPRQNPSVERFWSRTPRRELHHHLVHHMAWGSQLAPGTARPPGFGPATGHGCVRPSGIGHLEAKTATPSGRTPSHPGSPNQLAPVVVLCVPPGTLCIARASPRPHPRLCHRPRLAHTTLPWPAPATPKGHAS